MAERLRINKQRICSQKRSDSRIAFQHGCVDLQSDRGVRVPLQDAPVAVSYAPIFLGRLFVLMQLAAPFGIVSMNLALNLVERAVV